MKIAVPTMDGTSISAHFGRSKGFLVFELEGGAIKGQELRANGQHHEHAEKGGCHGHHDERGAIHDPQQGHAHGHDHGSFVRLLGDCQAVIVRGMGPGASQAMASAGIRVCLIREDITAEEAVKAFATGRLIPQEGASCSCHGH